VERSTRVELAGYRIYKSSAMEGPFLMRDLVPPTTFWTSPDLVPPAVWYLVRSLDTSDNESDDSMRIETTALPTLAAASTDDTARVIFSAEDAKIFSAQTNGLSDDMRITVARSLEQEQGNILGSYEIKSFMGSSAKEVKELKMARPTVSLEFRYAVGARGAYVRPNAVLRHFKGGSRDVGIFWNNNIEFVKFGGSVDEYRGTVSIKTARPLGKFQVKNVLRSSEFNLNQLTPRKIFTPNGDGINDEIFLFLENPRDSIISQAKIYDITGAEVADFEQGIVAGEQGVVSLKWNGKDKQGNIVRSGIYVYQIQAEGKVINGTIVVAR
jgi:hypothetical protein